MYIVGISPGPQQIHLANIDGSNDKVVGQFTEAPNTSGCILSHDGKLVAYISNNAQSQITVSNVNGSNPVTYTAPAGYYMYPVDFSPDGAKLAVSGGTGGTQSWSALINPSSGAQIGATIFSVGYSNWFSDSTQMLCQIPSSTAPLGVAWEILNTSSGAVAPTPFLMGPPTIGFIGVVAPDNTIVYSEGNLNNGIGPTVLHLANVVTGSDKVISNLSGAYMTLGFNPNYSMSLMQLAPALPTQNLEYFAVSSSGKTTKMFTVPNGADTVQTQSAVFVP
jgi:hypothetical protein